jgi:hypothetical protein
MTTKKNQTYAGIGTEAVAAKTGKGWDEWFAALDKAGAADWPHKEIATYLHDHCACPSWWSQMVTVGYEQARGVRVKHQVAGGFSASASKTIAVPVSFLYVAWIDAKTRSKWLPHSATITIRKATPSKSIRITWSDKTNVDVGFFAKGASKSQVAVEQRKLASLRAVARSKSYWATALESLKSLLEKPASKVNSSVAKPKRTK